METLVVTSVMAILAGIAVPQYSALATQMQTSAAAAQVLSDLNYARMMSLRTGVPHYVSVTANSPINYQIKREANPPNIQAGDPALRTTNLTAKMENVEFRLKTGVTVGPYGAPANSNTPPATLVFDGRGMPNAAGTFFITSKDDNNELAVTVTGVGRTRLFRRANGVWQ